MKMFCQVRWSALLFMVFTASLGIAPEQAQATSLFSSDRQYSLRTTLEKCLVRPYGIRADGSVINGAYESICEGVERSGLVATVGLAAGGRPEARYEVQLIGSLETQAADQLWDVAIWDENAHLVLEAQNVVALGDPFEAIVRLSGTRPTLRRHDDRLDEVR
ncbi:MAG: hypothetical protein KGQ59_11665 [Bdellovibrionales bacterium]|nr:hypothetical protein [Bdellovibrionales bacterium]